MTYGAQLLVWNGYILFKGLWIFRLAMSIGRYFIRDEYGRYNSMFHLIYIRLLFEVQVL